jgi:phytoene desaturase
MAKKTALVVGSGLGGLCTALRLAKDGYQVEIVEKFWQAGGRLNRLQRDGFTFDMAPTFFSMSYEFKEFEEYCRIKLPFEFVELDPLYKVNFSGDCHSYTIYKDLEKLTEEFEHIDPGFKQNMRRYLDSAAQIFAATENTIIKQNFNNFFEFFVQLTKVPLKHGPKMLRSIWKELNNHFSSYEAKVIFSLVSFFLGGTPFETPAVYTILNYTELEHDGYFNVKGGMYKIVEGLMEELERENVQIHYNVEITGYKGKGHTLEGFTDASGKLWRADVYVVNSDAAWFRGKIFERRKFSEARLNRMKWTLAPLTIYLGVEGDPKNLIHHNYFLGRNFEEYAAKVFKNTISLERPYYYVNVPSLANPGYAPEGCHSIFILCPVPDLRNKPDWSDTQHLADLIIDDLSYRIGFDINAKLRSKTVLNPIDWQNAFNLYKGSGLGLAHNMRQIGGFRPRNCDEIFHNVFYVGASTIPGTGLPMMVISSKLVTEQIHKFMQDK